MSVRLDKWLWAARIYKTRSVANIAIKAGKVFVNRKRTKPGFEIVIGDVLTVRQGYEQKTIIVHVIATQRGPASVAQQLYKETYESQVNREKEKQMRQLNAMQRPRGEGRPTKRARRQIHRFTKAG